DRKYYNNNNNDNNNDNNNNNNNNDNNNTNYLFNNNMLSPYNNFINQIICIHPYFILINNTNFNLVMCKSCNFYNNNNKNYKTSEEREQNKNKRNYYFPRHSSHVINLISSDVDRNFFFYISNCNNIKNYLFICGKVDISKESTIILCFLNNKNIKHKENTTKRKHTNNYNIKNNYNINNNNDKKHIKTGKQTYHVTFIHLKINICKGFKLQEYYKKNIFPNSMYIIISEYVNNMSKFEKYISYINNYNSNK
ncbi:putative membrane protein, partial [Plasmodium reichenowi]